MVSCNGNAQKEITSEKKQFEVTKADSEWKQELSDAEYRILRKSETERPYSSELNNLKKEGVYTCAACDAPLYQSKHKFESGTGWPSFDRAIKENVAYSKDNDLGFQRKEVHCAKCGGHLGHVFDDGPRETTGKRHCINGVAMDFKPAEE